MKNLEFARVVWVELSRGAGLVTLILASGKVEHTITSILCLMAAVGLIALGHEVRTLRNEKKERETAVTNG